MSQGPRVVSVSTDAEHRFSKGSVDRIELVAGIGVRGDAHAGSTVQHRFLAASNPTAPNLRQVHLIHRELFEQLGEAGFLVGPGELGENITTADVDLLSLPVGTRLQLGTDAVVELTGLRNPCVQINQYQPGLLKQVVRREPDGSVARLAGVMSVVLNGGVVAPGDPIRVELPDPPHRRLNRV